MVKKKESVFYKMREMVYIFMTQHLDVTDEVAVTLDDVYIVWCSKALQNWRALISTTLPDGRYYDCVYTGDDNTLTIRVYNKYENKHYSDKFEKDRRDRIEKLRVLVESYAIDMFKYGVNTSKLLFATEINQNDKYVFTVDNEHTSNVNGSHMLFELTANGNTSEIYFDAYKPFDTRTFKDFMSLEEK